MDRFFARTFRRLAGAAAALLAVAVIAGAWCYAQLRGSLPQLDGDRSLPGLGAAVTITRDDHGVPTVSGSNRADVARALGFVHAQDRFFQMDLFRRRAAGELAELFGPPALPLDRVNRPHGFSALAHLVLAALPTEDRALLEAYTAGVNAGLASLDAKPFEYFFLRAQPLPWRAEDSVLVIYAMTLDLQDPANTYEHSLMTLRDTLGGAAVEFFAPLLTPDDAALDGTHGPLAAIPGPDSIDLRAARAVRISASESGRTETGDEALRPGSNSFALAGTHTASGAALLANDPHLNLAVPNIWYRAVLEWPADSAVPADRRRVVGGTLPGLPLVVLGSNGHIAWGLTDAYADTNDLVPIDLHAVAKQLYRIPGPDLREIEIRRETLRVKNAAAETIETSWTDWGPIVGTDARGLPLAHRWVAYDFAATNLNFRRLETAVTAAEAVAIAHASGIPAHNFLVVDRDGVIAWTIAGKFPQRTGFDGRLPVSWTFGDRHWDGYVAPANVPALIAPANGRLWTANNRLVGDDALARIGDGGYAMPARAIQLRDRLNALEQAEPVDLLALQRDDRALFLERWQQRLLATLTPETVENNDARAELRALVENWNARASVDSVGYRLVRAFRTHTAQLALAPIFAPCVERMPGFRWRRFNYEPALRAMLREQPVHLLSREFDTWDALLLAAADRVVADLDERGVALKDATWGGQNRARIEHPLSRVLPGFVARFLNFPANPLAGDDHMPLVQSPGFGASMRLVVSPGREEEGLFQMPGGQSGHPLSPFYTTDHAAWATGRPAPLLPGTTKHVLTLTP